MTRVEITYDKPVIQSEIVDIPVSIATGFESDAILSDVQFTCGCTSLWIDGTEYKEPGIRVSSIVPTKIRVDTDGKKHGENSFDILFGFVQDGEVNQVHLTISILTLTGLAVLKQDIELGKNAQETVYVYTDVPQENLGELFIEVSDEDAIHAVLDTSSDDLAKSSSSPIDAFRVAGRIELELTQLQPGKNHFWLRISSSNESVKPIEIGLRKSSDSNDRLRQSITQLILFDGKASQVIFTRNEDQMGLKLKVVKSNDDFDVVIDDNGVELIVAVSAKVGISARESIVQLEDSRGESYEISVVPMRDE